MHSVCIHVRAWKQILLAVAEEAWMHTALGQPHSTTSSVIQVTCFCDSDFFLLSRVAFHLVSVIQRDPSCFYLYLALFTPAVYSARNVFSSSLHLFTFIHPCLFATLALCKIIESQPYKQPHMQIIHSKRNIINVKLLTWTLVNRQTRITVETWLWGGCWMFCFRWLCWLELACTSKPSESGSSVYLQSFFSFHPQVWSNMLTS